MADTAAVGIRLDATFFRHWMFALEDGIEEQCDYLTRLDAAIGDADHGINMRRGFRAVRLGLEGSFLAPAELFAEVGKRLVFTVGGAAGPLYGTAFRRLGTALMGLETVGSGDFARAMAAALAGIQELGAAEEGDKTMVDAFAPALRALTAGLETGRDLRSALGEAAAAAEAGMEATIPLRALKGRASYLGERSEGHQDPGATSTALLFRALADVAGA